MVSDSRDATSDARPAVPSPHGERTRIMLRPLASSVPLAFYAFGVGTTLYTAEQLQWIPLTQDKQLGVFLLAFAAPLQLLAGLIGYATRDAGLATVMTVLGASWVCLGITSLTSVPGARAALLGVFLISIAAVLTTMGVASAKARPLVFGLAMLAVARYALTGAYEIAGGSGLQHAAGWIGLPIIAISLYGGTAFLLEETTRRTILPLGRRHGALTAVQAGFDDQIENLGREAGVRHQL